MGAQEPTRVVPEGERPRERRRWRRAVGIAFIPALIVGSLIALVIVLVAHCERMEEIERRYGGTTPAARRASPRTPLVGSITATDGKVWRIRA